MTTISKQRVIPITSVNRSRENFDGSSNGTAVDIAMVAYPFSLRMTARKCRHDMSPALDRHQLLGTTLAAKETSAINWEWYTE